MVIITFSFVHQVIHFFLVHKPEESTSRQILYKDKETMF